MPITSNLDHHSGEWTPEPGSPAYIRDYGILAWLRRVGGRDTFMEGQILHEAEPMIEHKPTELRAVLRDQLKTQRRCHLIGASRCIIMRTERNKYPLADALELDALLELAGVDEALCCSRCLMEAKMRMTKVA